MTPQPTTALSAEELMIGNFIYWKGKLVKVTMIGEFGIQSKDRHGEINAKFSTPDLSGIPITPEILERCGFDYDTVTYCRNNILLAQSKIGFDVFFNGLTNGTVSHVNHLHQLQNIYFYLTGSHLTLNP